MKTTVRRKNQALVEQAIAALKAEKPMTLRQLYYRMVSVGAIANSQREYVRLGHLLTRLREARDVPRTWIVDHVRATLKPSSWSGLADFGDTVREAYRKDFWAGLAHHVEVFVEKDAIAGTIQPVTHEYDVALRVCRGYSSVSFAGEIADLWAEIQKPIFAYYLGDFDPSGFDLERDLREKLARYSGRFSYCGAAVLDDCNSFRWNRLAVMETDFLDHDLIALPVKQSDKRASRFIEEHGDECAEVDALSPNELRRRAREAIEGHIDLQRWEKLQRVERLEQQTLGKLVNGWPKESQARLGFPMASPTSRTLATLRKDGFTVDVVERWLPRIGVRKDLFGCIDLVAIRRGESGVLAVQATSDSNLSSRIRKARAEPRLVVWLASGNRFECWGWRKVDGRWHVRKVAVQGPDLAEVVLTAIPRRRRKSKGERQRELF